MNQFDYLHVLLFFSAHINRSVFCYLFQVLWKRSTEIKINKMIVDYVDDLTSTKEIAKALGALKQALWPGGMAPEPVAPRDDRAKYAARVCAKSVLLTLTTEQLQATMGSQTVKKGALRLFDMLQHSALNRRLFYVILECVMSTLYEKYPMKKVVCGVSFPAEAAETAGPSCRRVRQWQRFRFNVFERMIPFFLKENSNKILRFPDCFLRFFFLSIRVCGIGFFLDLRLGIFPGTSFHLVLELDFGCSCIRL